MSSLNHLKDNYRARYCNEKGQRQNIDIQQGHVLKYIQDCFETCAKECTVYSPNASHSSSPQSVHTQVSTDSKEKPFIWKKKKARPNQINCVKAAFNTFATSSLSGTKDRSSDEDVDVDVDVSLESPALLLEEERHMQVSPPGQNKIIEKRKSKSLVSLTSTTRSTKGCAGKLNSTYSEIENDCEFLIEESFGAPFTSWTSVSQNKRAKKTSLTASSETKKATKLQSIKRGNKRASKKPVGPQAVMKLDVVESTFDTSWINGKTAVVNDQSQLAVSSIQQATKFACSEDKQSAYQDNEDDQEPARKNVHSEDLAALLEEDHMFSLEPGSIIPTTQQSSFGKPVGKQKSPRVSQANNNQSEVERSNVKRSVRTRRGKNRVLVSEESSEDKQSAYQDNEDDQEPARKNVHSKDRAALLEQDHRFSLEPGFIIPTTQQSSFGKPVGKQKSPRVSQANNNQSEVERSNVKRSVRTRRGKNSVLVSEGSSEDKQSAYQDNEDDQEPARKNVHSEDLAALLEEDHMFSLEPGSIIPTTQQSSFGKPVGKQKSPRVSQANNNQSEVERSNVKRSVRTRRGKNRVLVSEESSEDKQSAYQDNEDDQEPARKNVHSKDRAALLEQDHRFSLEPGFIIPTTQQSSFGKPVGKQKSARISQANNNNQSEVERSNVKRPVRTRRGKNIALVSEESSEYGEQQCDKKTKNPHEQRTDLRKMPPLGGPNVRQTFLESSQDCDWNISHREDSCEQYVAEKRFVSTKQQNTATISQSSCAADENRNSGSGPVWYHKYKKTSTCENSSDIEDSVSDESVNLEENSEVFLTNTLKHKMIMPTNTPNVRRTKRIRLKPLEYWRGERVNYQARPSGGLVIGGIISPEQNQPRKSKNEMKAVMESENIQDDKMFFMKDPSQPALVFDPVSEQEILLECVSSGSSHSFFISNEALSVYKYLTTPSFSVGKIILKPLKEKGYQYSHLDTLIFNIIHGKLLLTLYDQCYSLATGDYFYIPAGNIYNIRNLLNTECVIAFTQLKGNRLEEN